MRPTRSDGEYGDFDDAHAARLVLAVQSQPLLGVLVSLTPEHPVDAHSTHAHSKQIRMHSLVAVCVVSVPACVVYLLIISSCSEHLPMTSLRQKAFRACTSNSMKADEN